MENNMNDGVLTPNENCICLGLLDNPNLSERQIHFLRSLIDDYINQLPTSQAHREILYHMFLFH
jgi:hypothetical protein